MISDGYNDQRSDERDSLDETRSDFPFDEICERIDRVGPILAGLQDDVREQVAITVAELNKELMSDALSYRQPDIMVGRIYLILNWILNPNVFTGDSISQAEIARCLGITQANLSPLAQKLSARFRIKNRFQAHNWRGRVNLATTDDQPTEIDDEKPANN